MKEQPKPQSQSQYGVTIGLGVVVCIIGCGALLHYGMTKIKEKNKITRVQRVYNLIDEINSQDPRLPPQELEYGKRMTLTLLEKYDPSASDEVKIACRGQHIARWRIPRSDFPEGKAGYLKWRKTLYAMHASLMKEILQKAGGFTAEEIDKVCQLVGKQWDLKTDPDANAVEDVAALVFLQYYFPSFTDKLNEMDKMVDIVRKTWVKMSERGHQEALKLQLPPIQAEIVQRALSGSASSTPKTEDE
jgi:hypothetical protein